MYGRSGIGAYVAQLVARLPKYLPSSELILFGDRSIPSPPNSLSPSGGEGRVRGREVVCGSAPADRGRERGMKFVRVCAPIYSLAEQIRMPLAVAGRGLSVFHCPHYNAPLAVGAPLIITVHDLIHLLFPEYLPSPRWLSRAYAEMQLRAACARATLVLTDSENTKRDLMKHLGIIPKKIKVVQLGVDENFAPQCTAARLAAFRRLHGLSAGYILHVGNLKPHKNLVRLVRAFATLPDRGLKLVFAGVEDRRYLDIRDTVQELRLGPRVVFTGKISLSELKMYYAAARALAFPSLYEGFGLPPLEAMACGIPVVASTMASTPEVTGNAALMVDPRSVQALSCALKAVTTNQDLRRRFIGRGFKRVKKFSWDHTVSTTAAFYMQVARGRN